MMGTGGSKTTDESKPLLLGDGEEEKSDVDYASMQPVTNPITINIGINQPEDVAFSPSGGDSVAQRQRLKYYYSLAKTGQISNLEVPKNSLPPELFIRTPFGSPTTSPRNSVINDEPIETVETPKEGKQSSIVTIFSLTNTMLGSSLLSLPWAFTQAGFGTSLAIVMICGFVCFYTAYLIVKNAAGQDDFSVMCRDCLGRPGYYISIACSILVLVGAAIAYDIIMSHSLFDFVNGLRDLISPHATGGIYDKIWTDRTVPLFLVALLFPFVNLKEFVVLVKLNSVGIVSLLYLLFFIPFSSFYKREIEFKKLPQYENKFYYLAGILTLAFLIHNCVISILKNNRHQEKNGRDLFAAYVVVGLTYSLVGAAGFVGYGLDAIPQDFLKLFPTTDIYSLVARFLMVIQLFSVYPLLLFIIRLQFFSMFTTAPYPGWWKVLILNFLVAATTTLFAMYYPQIGEVLRFTGAFCGLIYVFVLPVGVHWVMQKRRNELTKMSIFLHSLLIVFAVAILVSQFVP